MNWTGGRLQRHSRANANTILKLQREHFARAKLQARAVHKPLSPIGLSFAQAPYNRTGQLNAPQDDEPKRSGSPSRRNHPPEVLLPVHRVGPNNQPGHVSPVDRISDNGLPCEPADPPIAAEDRTIDHVKQQLLKNSDWLGLTVSRPPIYNFAPPEEMDKLGRRKIWRSGARRRKEQLQAANQAKSRLHNDYNGKDEHRFLTRPDESISIRIGSNIHGTQTSVRERTQPEPTQSVKSSATDSMILDQYEGVEAANPFRSIPVRKETVLQPRDHDRTEVDRESASVILPLNEVRDLETFEQVKARSESLTREVISRRLETSSSRSPVESPEVSQTHSSSVTPHCSRLTVIDSNTEA